MSIDATRWAWMQKGLRPIQKLILLSLADRAGADDCSYPSYEQLHEDTGADKKTIWQGIKCLQSENLICDTGLRKGSTGQVVVWRLMGIDHRSQEKTGKHSENGSIPKTGKHSENGSIPKTGKHSENGSIPKTGKHSENGSIPKTEAFRKRIESIPKTECESIPKTEYGTNHRNLPGTDHCIDIRASEIELPDWLPKEAWDAFVSHRKDMRAKLTDRAKELAIRELGRLRDAGNDPVRVIEASIVGGWKGLFPTKQNQGVSNQTDGFPQNQRRNGYAKPAYSERERTYEYDEGESNVGFIT